MALNSLNSVFAATTQGDNQESIFNKHSTEFRPHTSRNAPSIPCERREEDYFSTMGSALEDLLVEVKNRYSAAPAVSPVPQSALTTPQMTSVALPPPPGYDPIIENVACNDEVGDIYYDPTYSWRPYPPPFHLGYKLFVGALPYSVSELDLFPLFSQFGEILELHIQRDWLGRSKGCAWLRYSSMEECDAAIDALHNNYYLGSMNRPLQLTFATDKVASSVLRPRTFSMTEEVPVPSQAVATAARGRAMTDCSIPTPSSSVLGKLRQMLSSSEQSSAERQDVEAGGGPSPVKGDEASVVGRIFKVSGIPSSMTDREVENLFSQFGPISRAERTEPTVAVVEFRFPSDADRAKSVIDGVTLAQGDAPISVETVV